MKVWVLLGLAFGFWSFSAAEEWSEDWPQFRGPDRNGVAGGAGSVEAWPEAGLTASWTFESGSGFAEVAVKDGDVVLSGSTGDGEQAQETVWLCDAVTGKEKWHVTLGALFVDEFGDGPRATPVIAEDEVIALSSYGRLVALNRASGHIIWERDLREDFGSKLPRWGFSSSPGVQEDLVMLEVGGGEGKAIAAIDRKSGQTLWTSQDGGSSYSSPIMAEIHGMPQWVFVNGKRAFGLTRDGKMIWETPFHPGTIAMPVVLPPDRVFLSNPGDHGSRLVKLTMSDDAVQSETLWDNAKLKNNWSSSVVAAGCVFGFDNASLKCLDLTTGEVRWVKRGFGKGNVMLLGDHLVVLSDRGKLALAPAVPGGFQPISSFQALDGKCWTAPSVARGALYVRNLTQARRFALQ